MNAKVLGSVAVAALITVGGCGLSKPNDVSGNRVDTRFARSGSHCAREVEGCRGVIVRHATEKEGKKCPGAGIRSACLFLPHGAS